MSKNQTMRMPKIRQLKSGSFHTRIRIDGIDIPITRPTEKEVEDEYIALKRGIKDAKKESLKKTQFITLSDAIEEYVNSKDHSISPSTIRGYDTIKRNRFQKIMNKNIYDITAAEWQTICNDEAKLCSAKTLKNAWCLVASIVYSKTGNRFNITLPSIVPNERPYLNYEQIKVFINSVKGCSCEVPALMALCSLRRSEILAVKYSDIDVQNKIINVSGSAVMDRNNTLVYKKENKNASSNRVVPILMPQLLSALTDELRKPHSKDQYLIKANPNTLWAQINRICKESGLPLVGVHGLRHSFASLSYHLGVDKKTSMAIGGWNDDKTMERIYTHIAEMDIASAANKITNFYENSSKQKTSDSLIEQMESENLDLKTKLSVLQSKYDALNDVLLKALKGSDFSE